MNICVDVGNTTIGVGVYQNEKLIRSLSFTTDLVKTSDEYESIILGKIKEKGTINPLDVKNITFSSVVPEINLPLKNALSKVFINASFLSVSPGIKTGLSIKVDNPLEIGNDLIADLVGAKEKYGYPIIIADLGTASKLLVIDKSGAFSTALILPGLALSAQSLSSKASLLPAVSLETPKSVLAKNTIDAMNAGIIYGHAEMILGLVKRIEKELGYSAKHVLTGGSAILIKDILKDSFIYHKDLVLDGLHQIYLKNRGHE